MQKHLCWGGMRLMGVPAPTARGRLQWNGPISEPVRGGDVQVDAGQEDSGLSRTTKAPDALASGASVVWLRGQDLNLRPSGYEPDELPGCSTPRRGRVPVGDAADGLIVMGECRDDLCGPGGDRLSRVLRHSTMGAETFDGRVRDGIGSCRLAKATRPAKIVVGSDGGCIGFRVGARPPGVGGVGHGLMRAIKPNERLVPVSYTHCCASTPGLSTWWSSTALQGELVSRWVSSLDAFSSYPVRT